jgi:hypothetical protein
MHYIYPFLSFQLASFYPSTCLSCLLASFTCRQTCYPSTSLCLTSGSHLASHCFSCNRPHICMSCILPCRLALVRLNTSNCCWLRLTGVLDPSSSVLVPIKNLPRSSVRRDRYFLINKYHTHKVYFPVVATSTTSTTSASSTSYTSNRRPFSESNRETST